MLWQNAFLDTRWRFLVGLVLLTVMAMFVALGYPEVVRLLRGLPASGADGPIASEIAEAAALSRTYGGYVWSQWFRQNGAQTGAFFAVIIGTGGLLSQSSAARLFTLSMPVSREQLLSARAAAGLAQVLALCVVPAITLTLMSPLVAQRFPIVDSLGYALCLFAGLAVFFSLAFLFSSMFANNGAPVVLALCVGFALRAVDRFAGGEAGAPPFSLMAMMHGDSLFRGDGLPWLMLLVSAAASAVLIYGGIRLIARHDF